MRWPYPRIPAIAKGLPAKLSESQIEFDRRVCEQFPVGISETELLARLATAGFKVDAARDAFGSATVRRGIFIQTLWSVRWRALDGLVEEVWGVHAYVAP